ncbi:MAG: hypothetical protein L0323_08660 [Planctomycetes bacterium]|nr:hypothetical protein [Planctomycetota bacterium]
MRRPFALAVLAVAAFVGAGCSYFAPFVADPWGKSKAWVGYWDYDLSTKLRVWDRDLHSAHRTIDRYFFNYDWEDPYL